MLINTPSDEKPSYVFPVIKSLSSYASLIASTTSWAVHSFGKKLDFPPFDVLATSLTSTFASYTPCSFGSVSVPEIICPFLLANHHNEIQPPDHVHLVLLLEYVQVRPLENNQCFLDQK